MSDGQVLFVVICFIYFTDCFLWLGKQSLAFISMWRGKWRISYASSYLGTPNGGIVFMNPLPSLGQIYVCDLLPVSFSPRGLCVYNSQCLLTDGRPKQSGISIEFNDIKSILCSNKNVHINDSFPIRCNSAMQADSIARIVSKIIQTPGNEREVLIKTFLKQGFDTGRAKQVLNEITGHLLRLRSFCATLFIFLFILSPILVLQVGLTLMIIPVAAFMFIMATYISILFYKAHKRVYPAAKEERISNLIKMILCPPVAIRANDIITSKVLIEFSPVAIAKILLKKEDFLLFAQRQLLDLKHPIEHECKEQLATEIIAWHNTTLFDIIYDYLCSAEKITKIDLLDAPKPWDNQSKSYCPRCLCQFQIDDGECHDCVGVRLVPFKIDQI
jgi:hypothetical protein